MGEMTTGKDGTFYIDGTESEWGNIEPVLKIYHDCDDTKIGIPIVISICHSNLFSFILVSYFLSLAKDVGLFLCQKVQFSHQDPKIQKCLIGERTIWN